MAASTHPEIIAMSTSISRYRFASLLTTLSGCSALALSACGGGMGNTAASTTGTVAAAACGAGTCGPTVLTVTDAKGDFLSYIVTLDSLQLQTAAGASVETIPAATKVDFAQLVDLTEIISAGQIPAAEYVSATVTLDYTGANITADDGTGAAVALSPVDASGNPLTGPVTVTVQLDNKNHLKITPQSTGRLAFDFNLAASNTVNLASSTVTVSPTLVASAVPSDTKQIRVRGALASASAAQNDFVLNVQPFHDHTTTGQVTASVTATTTYQIDGTSFQGATGLAALAAVPTGTMVAAFGTLQRDTQSFTAATVLAGTSLENPAADLISGTVIARSATTLTVRGATWSHKGGDDFDFQHRDVTVTVGANTVVTEEGSMNSFTVADISVGQHIEAFGAATAKSADDDADHDSGGNDGSDDDLVSLDATSGQVRLDLTPAWGLVTNLAAGSVTLNLQSLDGRAASEFSFAGTGTSAANDATAGAYIVNTGTLDQTALAMSAPARVIGFATPFGKAPADFTAQTLVNFAAVSEELVVDFGHPGSATAFTGLTAASTSLLLDLTNVGDRHFVEIGPEQLDLTTLATAPAIVADPTATTDVFTIGHEGKLKNENFNSFAAFIAALAQELGGASATGSVITVTAAGSYDSASNTYTATRVAVLIKD
jgi:hypothetical protein